MELTEHKYSVFKRPVLLYKHSSETDKYKNVYTVYAEEPVTIPNIMITPYQRDETAIELYGETDKQRAQFVYYGSENIRKLDKIADGSNVYKVVAILNYQTHKIIELELLD